MVACVQTPASALRFLIVIHVFLEHYVLSTDRLFYEGAQKLEEVMNTTMNTEIMNTLSRIVAISITIIFLAPMFPSLYFYRFPNPPPPLPHFHCFPSTTTITTTRNTTYLRNPLLCISLIINMKKQRRKIKNVVSPPPPALIIQHANTNSDIICFIAKNCSLIFIC